MADSPKISPLASTKPNAVFVPPMSIPKTSFFIVFMF